MELTFRGVIFRVLAARYSLGAATVLSLAAFALAHLYGGTWLVVNAVQEDTVDLVESKG